MRMEQYQLSATEVLAKLRSGRQGLTTADALRSRTMTATRPDPLWGEGGFASAKTNGGD